MLGTAHVLDAVRAEGVAAVVVVTSDKCYAARASDHAHREEDALGGRDPYSAAMAAQELVAASHRETYGLPLATARAGNVIGGGDCAEDRVLAEARKAMSGCSHVIHLAAIVGSIATTSSPTR